MNIINKLLNDRSFHQDSEMHISAIISNLIVHFELGNTNLLEYLIKSVYRFLKKNEKVSYQHKIMIDFLRKIP